MEQKTELSEDDRSFQERIRPLLVDIAASGNQLLDPPEELWDNIAAAVAADQQRRSGDGSYVVEYRIDAHDVVITAGVEWNTFAAENGAAELAEGVPSNTLWSYFDNEEITDIWRAIVQRVRETGAPADVPLRCDGPDTRRWFEMTVTPESDGSVHFRSVLTFEEPRAAVALLDWEVDRDPEAPPVPLCSWCGRGHDGHDWVPVEQVVRNLRLLERDLPSISNGICGTCRDEMTADLLVGEAHRGSSD